MSAFGAVWWIAGAVGTGWPILWTYPLPFLAVLVLVGSALRARRPVAPEPDEQGRRIGRLVGIASGVEGLAILVAVNVLANIGSQALTIPAIAIIVGLHFLPLAKWIPARLYYGTAVTLTGLGFIGIWISDPVLRLEVVCSGSAMTLWLTCVLGLMKKPRREIRIGHAT